jgi:hypothetical protein
MVASLHDALPLCRPRNTEPRDHGQKPLTPWAKINLSSIKLLFSNILLPWCLTQQVTRFLQSRTCPSVKWGYYYSFIWWRVGELKNWLSSPDWSWTHSPPASASPVMGLQACATMPVNSEDSYKSGANIYIPCLSPIEHIPHRKAPENHFIIWP